MLQNWEDILYKSNGGSSLHGFHKVEFPIFRGDCFARFDFPIGDGVTQREARNDIMALKTNSHNARAMRIIHAAVIFLPWL
jgi:hypothetical protein